MDIVNSFISGNIDGINYELLDNENKHIYKTMDKMVNYTIPRMEGRIVYDKEKYATYCKMIRDAMHARTINLNMSLYEIFDKVPYPELDRGTRISIINKLTAKEKSGIVKSPHICKMDRDYVNEIVSLSQNIINKISNMNMLIQYMEEHSLTQIDVIKILMKHYDEQE